MLNFISNSSAFVLKRFRLLYGRDKDSLSKVLMFVQSHAQTVLLSSTIFYHITCFKCDLCRVCSEFLKSVEWIRYNVPIKSINQHISFGRFYPRPVLAFGYCRCLRLCVCVCLSVCQSRVCPRDNSSPVQARITKFGAQIQNTLVKVPIVLWGDRPWPSRSNLTWKSILTSFWACPDDNLSSV